MSPQSSQSHVFGETNFNCDRLQRPKKNVRSPVGIPNTSNFHEKQGPTTTNLYFPSPFTRVIQNHCSKTCTKEMGNHRNQPHLPPQPSRTLKFFKPSNPLKKSFWGKFQTPTIFHSKHGLEVTSLYFQHLQGTQGIMGTENVRSFGGGAKRLHFSITNCGVMSRDVNSALSCQQFFSHKRSNMEQRWKNNTASFNCYVTHVQLPAAHGTHSDPGRLQRRNRVGNLFVDRVKGPSPRLPVAPDHPAFDQVQPPSSLTSFRRGRRKLHILLRCCSRVRHPQNFDHWLRPHTWRNTFLGLYPRLTLWLWCDPPIRRITSRRALSPATAFNCSSSKDFFKFQCWYLSSSTNPGSSETSISPNLGFEFLMILVHHQKGLSFSPQRSERWFFIHHRHISS